MLCVLYDLGFCVTVVFLDVKIVVEQDLEVENKIIKEVKGTFELYKN